MNLLKELEPFHKQIDAFKAGYGITDTVVIQKLADIWDAFGESTRVYINDKGIEVSESRKKSIYGSETAVIPRTKTTCASCIKDMMNMLCNWREIVTREEGEKLVEFKSVKAKVEVVNPESTQATEAEEIAFYKTHLNAAGIQYHHKAGVKKLSELYQLLKGEPK